MPDLTRREWLQLALAAGPLAAVGDVRGDTASAGSSTPAPGDASVTAGTREHLLFDFGWRFHLGHANDLTKDFGYGAHQRTYAKAGANTADAARLDFDDGDWARIDLPHDWAVTLPFDPGELGPSPGVYVDDPAAAHGYKPLGRRYPDTSVGWYRRVFEIPATDLGRRIHVRFDGVFRDCLVFCNGHVVARNESGYCGFSVDLTDVLDYGARNVIAVRVDATLGEGWFYEGAGIYRHAWLQKLDPLHVPDGGVFVRCEVHKGRATVLVGTELRNDGPGVRGGELRSIVLAPDGRVLARLTPVEVTLQPGELRQIDQRAEIQDPELWSIEAPRLHRLVTALRGVGAEQARLYEEAGSGRAVVTVFGIRHVEFSGQRGFLLNGKPVKLLGTCNHQDHAGVGAAIPDRLQEWRIERLKEMGSNAYRSSHNPPTPELLDICDRLGMVVIVETRRMGSDAESLDQLERMVRRDRNHACVVLWSLGNEEPQMTSARGARIVRSMKALTNRLDPTRLVTFAMDKGFGSGVSEVVDVLGFNYRTNLIDAHHARFPGQPLLASESGSTVCTRGEYRRDDVRGVVRAYDIDHPWWASTAEAWWSQVATRDYVAGGFVWTGFDYRGEPTPFNRWPNVSSQFGIFDTCGFPKDNYWYYQAQWTREPVLHLFPHWNWRTDGDDPDSMMDVWCHSNLDRVELLVNGTSQGIQDVPRHGHVEWRVRYAPGAIEAHGYRDGKRVLTRRRETTGAAVGIALQADRLTLRADAEDLAMVTVRIVDAQGREVPTAGNEVQFVVHGPARLIGVGNGDPTSHESDQGDRRRAFNGRCMAIVQATRATGAIRIEARSPGVASGMLALDAAASPARAYVA